jgi:hypothetical protein
MCSPPWSLPGGATMVEFKTQVPGTYIHVDPSLGRLQEGAARISRRGGTAQPADISEHSPGQPRRRRSLMWRVAFAVPELTQSFANRTAPAAAPWRDAVEFRRSAPPDVEGLRQLAAPDFAVASQASGRA